MRRKGRGKKGRERKCSTFERRKKGNLEGNEETGFGKGKREGCLREAELRRSRGALRQQQFDHIDFLRDPCLAEFGGVGGGGRRGEKESR